MTQTRVPFVANPGDRLAPLVARAQRVTRGQAAIAILVALLVHAVMLTVLQFEYADSPGATAALEETPIEVVMEPPPPPPPPPQPKADEAQKPQPPAPRPSLRNSIATDAPRARNEEKADRKAPDPASASPKQAPPTPQAQREARAQTEQKQIRGPEAKPAEPTSAKPAEDKPDAEVIEPLAPPGEKEVKAAGEIDTPSEKPLGPLSRTMGTMALLQDYKTAAPSTFTGVATGKAQEEFVSIVFGLIQAKYPDLRGPRAGGAVQFVVDGAGQALHLTLTHPSGNPARDAAVLKAVALAAPYPPSPLGGPLPVTLNF